MRVSSKHQPERGTDRREDNKQQPLVSIIIVVYRDYQELKLLLHSVMPNRSDNVEIVVIDGGSDDGSVDLLKTSDADIDYWISEPDSGLYDAMNKGIAAARGRFVYHINAGDRLLRLPLEELRDSDAHEIDIVAFSVAIEGTNRFRPAAGWRLRINNTLHHQGTFYRRSKFPGYDLRYRVFADFDLNQRMTRQGARVRLYETTIATHTGGGISHQRGVTKELYRVVAANYGVGYVPLTWIDGKWKGLKRRLARYAIHA